MNVNSALRTLLRNQFAIFSGILITIATIFIASSFAKPSKSELFVKRVNLTIREIGHHLLLQSGDFSSRVLPVKEVSDGVFVLEFENKFFFKPDTLVALTQRFLAKTGLSDYTVTVHECFKPGIVYGFQISPPTNNIEGCKGRSQPKGCYTIQIAFANFADASTDYTSAMMVSGFLFLFSIVVIFKRFGKNTSKNDSRLSTIVTTPPPFLGKFSLDVQDQKLLLGDVVIVLTDKEYKILEILNSNFGKLTSRDELIEKIWASEGVITGRSLDMFVSKLRKKLSADPEVKITNIHGKGYKLELIPG